mmetsp:Transcript_58863/g.124826  ORF Transcript_58863/g.124826 Transcript_58863/m.124826 type:complete len:331 (-) Transcript_58863:433-1425(-)|eukprot:CAMPEP_0206476268 /NCGR_PEP_ID=MMETSP0324_2-20121206/34616_1 /ASSEMBLY_ACC=CAM_ASM_000836 /TAXON_ID=2866 /ORGANISM="Crypthecodinium cohnii, Strain Seligo" /LENGTH=330 /DNA_ID=CAMNT_0053951869 /DNA_START=84 /DNA_END=1076 /DNA_ORIENTATION=-
MEQQQQQQQEEIQERQQEQQHQQKEEKQEKPQQEEEQQQWPRWALDWIYNIDQDAVSEDWVVDPDKVALVLSLKDDMGNSLLQQAVIYGDDTFVGFLLQKAPALLDVEPGHSTPLHQAAGNGFWRIVQTFLSAGASPSSLDKEGQSPLHMACHQGWLGCSRLLLEASTAELDLQDWCGCTPLHLALNGGYLELVELLVEKATLSTLALKDKAGMTVLHQAARLGHVGTVEKLLNKAGSVDLVEVTCKGGETPLHQAAKWGRCSVVEFLVEKASVRANVNAVSDSGETPLMLASESMLCVSEAAAMETLRVLERACGARPTTVLTTASCAA